MSLRCKKKPISNKRSYLWFYSLLIVITWPSKSLHLLNEPSLRLGLYLISCFFGRIICVTAWRTRPSKYQVPWSDGFLGYIMSYTAKNQLVGNLGWDKQRFGQTLIHGLTTFAHKLSIPPWTVIFSVHQKSPFSAEKVTWRCYKCVTTSLYASLILLKLPLK